MGGRQTRVLTGLGRGRTARVEWRTAGRRGGLTARYSGRLESAGRRGRRAAGLWTWLGGGVSPCDDGKAKGILTKRKAEISQLCDEEKREQAGRWAKR